MKKILIIHTGGTISMLENKSTGEVDITNKHPLSGLSAQYSLNADVDEVVIFDLPSPHITPNHMLEIAKKITESLPQYDGIVITHGTDTLEETAYFLDLILDTEKPVIVTGAMRSSNELGSDAIFNLICSLNVAADNEARNKGVLVVMNAEIHTAANVTKTSTSSIAAFKSPQSGPIGIITKDAIVFHHTISGTRKYPVSQITNNVYLLKAFAGMDEKLIHAIRELQPDGLVIEALGQGNLPAKTMEPIKQMLADEIPIVLVSRSTEGYVQPTYAYEGGGSQLKDLGVIFAKGLTGQKARIKLLITMERTKDINELSKLFT